MAAFLAGLAAVAVAAEPAALTVDTHLHVTMARAAKPLFRGEPGSGVLAHSTRPKHINQIDADQLIKVGGQLALATLWPPFRTRPGRTSLDEALHQVEELKSFCRLQPQFALVTSAASARAQIAKGRIALVAAIEGGEGIESPGDVDRLYAAGVRSITLMHFNDNALGGAARGQFAYNVFSKLGEGLNPLGLTEMGKAAVQRMLELGIIVDLSHASDATSSDVLDLAQAREVPVINSHCGSRALLPMERNVSDALAARIAAGGGMVGVTLSDHQVAQVPDSEKWEGYAPGTCDDAVAHWRHLAKVVPPERLTLGSDFNGTIARPSPGGLCRDGIRNTGDLTALYAALSAKGLPAELLRTSGERFLKLWDTVEQKADAVSQADARSADPTPHSTFDVGL